MTTPPTGDRDPVGSRLLRELFREPSALRRKMLAKELGRHWADKAIQRIEAALDRTLGPKVTK